MIKKSKIQDCKKGGSTSTLYITQTLVKHSKLTNTLKTNPQLQIWLLVVGSGYR